MVLCMGKSIKDIEDKIKTTIAKLTAEGKERDIENTIKIIKMHFQILMF